MRCVIPILVLCLTFAAATARAEDATLNGEAEVTGKA